MFVILTLELLHETVQNKINKVNKQNLHQHLLKEVKAWKKGVANFKLHVFMFRTTYISLTTRAHIHE